MWNEPISRDVQVQNQHFAISRPDRKNSMSFELIIDLPQSKFNRFKYKME